jgi:hypothetical protein
MSDEKGPQKPSVEPRPEKKEVPLREGDAERRYSPSPATLPKIEPPHKWPRK